MKFSKKTGCFYPEDIRYPSLPADLIAVSPDEYDAAMSRAAGETLDIVRGRLVIVPAPVVSPVDKLAKGVVAALITIDHFHADTVQKLVGNPTQVEKDTWAMKLGTAKSIAAMEPLTAEGQAFLEGAGLATSAKQAQWAARVMANAAAYARIVGMAETLRSMARVAVHEAQDEAAVQAAVDAHRAGTDAAVAELQAAS